MKCFPYCIVFCHDSGGHPFLEKLDIIGIDCPESTRTSPEMFTYIMMGFLSLHIPCCTSQIPLPPNQGISGVEVDVRASHQAGSCGRPDSSALRQSSTTYLMELIFRQTKITEDCRFPG